MSPLVVMMDPSVSAGDTVMVALGSPSTDDDAVECADHVDFDRHANRHCASGGGIRRCLGSLMARCKLRLALRERHRRVPAYHITDGAELEWAPLPQQVEHLPLVFDGARR